LPSATIKARAITWSSKGDGCPNHFMAGCERNDLRFFGGLAIDETAKIMDMSPATVEALI